MAAQSVMLNLELPHINLLSKMDLVGKSVRKRLDRFLNPDAHAILGDMEMAGSTIFSKKYKKLSEAIGQLIEDYSIVRFIPLNIKDEEGLNDVLMMIDNVIQFGEDQDVRTYDFDYPEEEKDD